MPAFIQNCFAKHGFGTPSAVNIEENYENGQVGGTEGYTDCPSIFSDFLMLTNQSQPLIVKRQVLTDLAAAWCMWWGGGREKAGNAVASNVISSQKCVNYIVSGGLCWSTSDASDRIAKPWIKLKVLCQRYIRTFWNKSQQGLTLGNSELTSEFDKCEVLCAGLHCDVKCIKVGSNHLQNKYKKGLIWLLN